jgi:hypothetical protein
MEGSTRGRAPGGERVTLALWVVVSAGILGALIASVIPQVANGKGSLTTTSTRSVVSPFFEVVVWRTGERRRLVRLRVFGVPASERVIDACSACSGAHFRKTVDLNRVTLAASHALRMSAKTRIIVGATFPGSVGRWIVIGFEKHQYRGLSHGCMPPDVTSLSPASAADPSRIPKASCTRPCPSPTGSEYVQWQGTDGQLWEMPNNGHAWGTALPVGSGTLGSAPSVVVRLGGQRDSFWRGTNDKLSEMWYGGFWTDPIQLRAAGRLGSAPAAVVATDGVEHVIWRGTNGWLWELSDPGGVWSASVPLDSGRVGSAPTILATANSGLDVFWEGVHTGLWEMRYAGGWQPAHRLSGAGRLGSLPAAAADAQGVEHVFWRGTNGWLWELSNGGGHWGKSMPVNSGRMGSAPAAVTQPDGQLNVFWKGTDGRLRELISHGSGWSNPIRIAGSGRMGSKPTAALGRCS